MQESFQILLVDDSPFDRGMVRRELRQEFPEACVHEVTNASEFAAALEATKFDLVITDYQIRWTDGLQVTRTVKERLPNCPVLMFTATGSEEIAVEAMKNGLDDYVIKNANHMVRLRTAVRALLEHSRTRIRAERLADRLESLLSHLRVGVFRRTADGRITEANDAAAVILGHTGPHDLIGKKLQDCFDEAVTNSRATVPNVAGGLQIELVATRTDGSAIWLAISERRVSGENGDTMFEGLLEDVSVRRNAENELLRIQDEMAHMSRINTMAEIAAGIAHELNQPLSAMANYAQACTTRLNQSDASEFVDVHKYLESISDLAHHSGKVIRSLCDFTRRSPRNPTLTKLGELICTTLVMLQFEVRKFNISVELNLPDPDIILTIDPVQIRQVVMNLIRNSIDAMLLTAVGGRVLSISACCDDGNVAVQVRDQGVGIADDQISRLFEPFVSSKAHGAGIGLSVSSRIIRAHGGCLKGWNNDNGGATFSFTLPLDERRPE